MRDDGARDGDGDDAGTDGRWGTESGDGDDWDQGVDEWDDPTSLHDDGRDGGGDAGGGDGPFETPAGANPPRPGPVWAVVAAVGVTLAAIALGIAVTIPVVLGLSVANVEIGLFTSIVLSFVLLQYVGFGGVSLGYLSWRGIDVREYVPFGVPSLRQVAIVLGGWLTALGLIVVASIVVAQLGLEPAANQTTQEASQDPILFLYLIPVMFLIVGPMEELLFRGVVQGRLREALSPAPAIVITASIFAPVHVIALTGGLSGRLTTIAILFVPSLVFGAQYEYTENLTVNALTHAVYNSTLLVLGYAASQFSEEGTEALLALL
jgi:membrane protease YdiL (CAAX protease family)